jgi:putative transposase
LLKKLKHPPINSLKERRLSKFKFEWQKGYGAFTHSHSQIDIVAKYILSQEEHHKKKSFREEYFEILEKNDVQFKDEYVFEFFNDVHGWD